jgi:hypothetical protein
LFPPLFSFLFGFVIVLCLFFYFSVLFRLHTRQTDVSHAVSEDITALKHATDDTTSQVGKLKDQIKKRKEIVKKAKYSKLNKQNFV